MECKCTYPCEKRAIARLVWLTIEKEMSFMRVIFLKKQKKLMIEVFRSLWKINLFK